MSTKYGERIDEIDMTLCRCRIRPVIRYSERVKVAIVLFSYEKEMLRRPPRNTASERPAEDASKREVLPAKSCAAFMFFAPNHRGLRLRF
mmetsp:Transcript_18997/g.47193  ORF Transcript_18997/g.47193 Transcript_18997/m.47193 type:complete len:90 (-) Transcript_18997:3615-3884(-)